MIIRSYGLRMEVCVDGCVEAEPHCEGHSSLSLSPSLSLKPHAVRTAEALIDIHKCTDSNIYDCTLRKNTTNHSRLNSSRHLWCSHVEANFQLYLQTVHGL